ncbi:hypothetical protein EKQ44_15735 [Sutcliffiella horikoshii]|nr:hypothetical protein [Sutcliffiella horikoshii]
MLRPRRAQPEEAQGRPAESEAVCGNQQRYGTDYFNNVLFQWLWRSPRRFPDRPTDKRSAWNEDQLLSANLMIIRVCLRTEQRRIAALFFYFSFYVT